MKNITISIDKETYRKARIRAAEKETSVSAVVRDYLKEFAEMEDKQISEARDQMNKLFRQVKGFKVGKKIPREELHVR